MTTKFFPKGVQGDYVKPIPDEPDFVSGYSHGLAYPSSGHLYKAATAKINKPHWRRPKAIRMLHDIQQLDVHGGVTFFGGYCAHYADAIPVRNNYGVYRDVAFVKEQLVSMAASFGSYQNRRG